MVLYLAPSSRGRPVEDVMVHLFSDASRPWDYRRYSSLRERRTKVLVYLAHFFVSCLLRSSCSRVHLRIQLGIKNCGVLIGLSPSQQSQYASQERWLS